MTRSGISSRSIKSHRGKHCALGEPHWELARTLLPWTCARWSLLVARPQEVDARLLGDGACSRDRGHDQSRNQHHCWSRSAVGRTARGLARHEFPLEVSRLPVWSCGGFGCFLCCVVSSESARWSRIPRDPDLDRPLPSIPRSALFVRCCLRRRSGNFGRSANGPLTCLVNPSSESHGPRCRAESAEGVRFELTRPFGLPVFKTGAINRSATPPEEFGRAADCSGAL